MNKEYIKSFADENSAKLFRIHRELCLIPAFSGHEYERAVYCRDYLLAAGADNVYIDDAMNTVFPLCCDGSDRITVINAHTDTVFPEDIPLYFTDDGERISCPGVGDDTAALAVLLLTAEFFIKEGIKPEGGILFVCNSCEEGLGNLRGIKQICEDYSGRIARHFSIDAHLDAVADRCVGSERFEVSVKTAGGHSFSAFGTPNAIAIASEMVCEIYSLTVPDMPGTRTTYNVGIISGGNSVNSIAGNASFLCEYRSDDRECIAIMREKFESVFGKLRPGADVSVRTVGIRPCEGNTDRTEIERMASLAAKVQSEITGLPVRRASSSTDCNIPLSLGIPSVCIGAFFGGGAHTVNEYIIRSSLPLGLQSVIRILLEK
ncbi:MAG: M20/M25/M40 family metallo-hydrolase [Clostridia bacterium]|nr:M20/M25/M40 family metallo-hydrolase [Clostridia bacterium]